VFAIRRLIVGLLISKPLHLGPLPFSEQFLRSLFALVFFLEREAYAVDSAVLSAVWRGLTDPIAPDVPVDLGQLLQHLDLLIHFVER
jgi:hypothetical protein